jgi:hypothetical protein
MKAPYILDIVTTPLPKETLLARAPEFKPAANLKDPAKIAEDIERKKRKYIEDAHLSEATAMIACVAIASYDNPKDSEIITNSSEKDLLATFKGFIEENRFEKIITFRGIKFVYPFISRRGATHGFNFFNYLVYPAALQSTPLDQHIDIAKLWSCGSISHPDTLEEITGVVGIDYHEPTIPYHELVETSESEAYAQVFNKLETISKIAKLLGV